MTPVPSDEQARWRKVRDIFAIATDAGSSDRQEIVHALCGDDSSLRTEVEELLALRAQPGLALDRRVLPPERQREMLDEAAGESAARYQPGEAIGEHYRIVRFLARGGMGEVYEAEDARDGTKAALKFVRQHPEANARADARFLREIHLARKIDHPNVCRVLDLGEHDGDYYCAMELLEGETLSARLARTGKLSPEQALPIARQICEGLEAAHNAGVFHRDLKPSNILLAGPRAVIIDFGLAAPVIKDESLTATGAVIGTLAYIAPEQLESGGGSPQADLYSLGVTLYETLTGAKPHDAKSPFRLAAQKVREAHQSGPASLVGVPALWREVIARCLKPRPEDRFADAAQIRQALERRRPSLRFLLQQRRVWIPAAALACTALAGSAWTLVQRDHTPPPKAAERYAAAYQAITAASPQRAIKELEQAVQADPKFIQARSLLAVAHSQTDQPERAKDALLQAIALKDSSWFLGRGDRLALEAASAVVTRDFLKAAEQYRQLALVPGNQEFATLSQAAMQQQAGRFDDAIQLLQTAIRDSPQAAFVPAARVRLAGLYARRPKDTEAAGQYAQAEAAYQKSGNLEGLCDLWIARALSAASQSLKEDRRDLERASELSAQLGNRYQHLSAKLRMVKLLELERNYPGAVAFAKELADEAQRQGMIDVAAAATSEHGYALVFMKDWIGAEPILRSALALAERSKSPALLANIRVKLAEVIGTNQRPAEAAPFLEAAIDWYRKDGGSSSLPLILIKWGATLATLPGRTREAPTVYLEAHDLAVRDGNPMFQSMALQRLTDYYGFRDLRKAAEYGEKALVLARQTRQTSSFYTQAWIWQELGHFNEARKMASEAERQIREQQPPADQPYLFRLVRERRAWGPFFQGNCSEALTAAKGLEDRARATNETLLARARACSGASDAALRSDLAHLEVRMKVEQAYSRRELAIAAGDVALHLKDWSAAKRFAQVGIELSRSLDLRTREMECLLILRAAEFHLGNREAVIPLTNEVLHLAQEVGFDEPAKFGGRHDLLYFWNLANVQRRP